ncbi:MAG TPA: hypothetical protein VKZ53_16645 [Candidatus Angelobacter sp.]|nr:hypothetical protein [Candidatus Angelobacter sp.]
MLYLAVIVSTCGLACLLWYWLSVRYNRAKAVRVLRWIQAALAGQGHVVGIRWLAPSQFRVSLRLASTVFQRAWILVELAPRHKPLAWFHRRRQPETLIFQADLDLPPAFSLDVHRFRWFARNGRKLPLDEVRWNFAKTVPCIITTRKDWQKEIAGAMTSLSGGNSYGDYLDISFQRKSPHFSVTLPLEAISPASPTRHYMLETMRELAANSSASLS